MKTRNSVSLSTYTFKALEADSKANIMLHKTLGKTLFHLKNPNGLSFYCSCMKTHLELFN